jgi:hypothetical protein
MVYFATVSITKLSYWSYSNIIIKFVCRFLFGIHVQLLLMNLISLFRKIANDKLWRHSRSNFGFLKRLLLINIIKIFNKSWWISRWLLFPLTLFIIYRFLVFLFTILNLWLLSRIINYFWFLLSTCVLR